MSADLTVLVASPLWANFPIVPHSLMELAAFIRERGHPVEILAAKGAPEMPLSAADIARLSQALVAELERRRPAVVGLSCCTTDYWCIRELAEEIRRRLSATIVVGGVHATLEPADFLYSGSPFDIVVVGEGEETLHEILERGPAGGELGGIRGIVFRRDGEIVRTSPRGIIEDLGTLPQPAYDLVDLDYYLRPSRNLIRMLVTSGLQLYSSRGCPFACTFCAGRMLYECQGLTPTIRHRPLEQILGTLRWLREGWGIECFYLADDTFALPRERALEFCRRYRESGLPMVWAAQTRANLLDDELAAEFARSGCVQLDFGIESGSDEALRRMKKGITVAQIRQAAELCRAHGLRVFANIMFNTPGETAEDVALTRRLMKELRADHYGIMLTVPFPGTKIFEERIGHLTPEEYRIFSHPDTYHRIHDPRLRLAAHDLDLDRLYVRVNLRFFLLRSLLEFTWRGWYLRLLGRSPRKLQYLGCYLRTSLSWFRYFGSRVVRLLRTL